VKCRAPWQGNDPNNACASPDLFAPWIIWQIQDKPGVPLIARCADPSSQPEAVAPVFS